MTKTNEQIIIDDLELFIAVLPYHVSEWIVSSGDYVDLLEVSMDLGRPARCWFPDGDNIADQEITQEDINFVI